MLSDDMKSFVGVIKHYGYDIRDAVVVKSDDKFFVGDWFDTIIEAVRERYFTYVDMVEDSIESGKPNVTRRLDKGESGFFDSPDCVSPFKNAIYQGGGNICVWLTDLSDTIKDRTDSLFYKYSLLFFPALRFYDTDRPVERIDVYLTKEGFFDFGESFVKDIDGKPAPYNFGSKFVALTLACCLLRLISVINCKNISLVNNKPSTKANRKRQKRGKLPLSSYYTITINPTGKKQREQFDAGLWSNRLHLCRGHFKTYSKEKPLFGKIHGRFWWQPTMRGASKNGEIFKDYQV